MASHRDDPLWSEIASSQPDGPVVHAVYARRRTDVAKESVPTKKSSDVTQLSFVPNRKTSWIRSLSTRGRSSIVISCGADFRPQPKQTKEKRKPKPPLHKKATTQHGPDFSKERAYFQEVDSYELIEESPSPKLFGTWATSSPQQSLQVVQDLPSILEKWLIAKKLSFSSHSSCSRPQIDNSPVRMQMEPIQEYGPNNLDESSSRNASYIMGSLRTSFNFEGYESSVSIADKGKNLPGELDISDKDLVEDVGKLSLSNKSDAFAKLLMACGQRVPSKFSEVFSQYSDVNELIKIGEGTYGEAFKAGENVFKIVPIDGDLLVNGEIQKKSDEVLEEVCLCLTLNKLRGKGDNSCEGNMCTNFIETKDVQVCQGAYDYFLLSAWEEWDHKHESENDHPKEFTNEQCYVVFVLADGGRDLESFVLLNINEARSLLLQVTAALAVGEVAYEFEHRDLHWGNILIARSGVTTTEFILEGKEMKANAFGIVVSIIDFTLSRIKSGEVILFFDLSTDPELFEGPKGDKQSETYRGMKKVTRDMWEGSYSKTNVLWLQYLVDILLLMKTFKRTAADERDLRSFRKSLKLYNSAKEALSDPFFSDMWIQSSIRRENQ